MRSLDICISISSDFLVIFGSSCVHMEQQVCQLHYTYAYMGKLVFPHQKRYGPQVFEARELDEFY